MLEHGTHLHPLPLVSMAAIVVGKAAIPVHAVAILVLVATILGGGS